MNASAPQSIGALIRAFRNERGLTQNQFGDLVGTDGQRVYSWEKGRNYPHGYLAEIARALGIPVEDLPPDPKAKANADETRRRQQAEWDQLRDEARARRERYEGILSRWLVIAQAEAPGILEADGTTADSTTTTAGRRPAAASPEEVMQALERSAELGALAADDIRRAARDVRSVLRQSAGDSETSAR